MWESHQGFNIRSIKADNMEQKKLMRWSFYRKYVSWSFGLFGFKYSIAKHVKVCRFVCILCCSGKNKFAGVSKTYWGDTSILRTLVERVSQYRASYFLNFGQWTYQRSNGDGCERCACLVSSWVGHREWFTSFQNYP